MVAHAEKVSSKAPKRPARQQIPLFTRLKAKNLYVGQMASASTVAAACGLTEKQVYNLSDREGWTKLRMETKSRLEQSVNARTQAAITELTEHIADETAELSLGTLAKAKRTLERDDEFAAKDLQAYSVAAKNFVGLYRQAKQLDVAAAGDGATSNTIVFMGDFVRASTPETEPRNVTPDTQGEGGASSAVIDVAPTDGARAASVAPATT